MKEKTRALAMLKEGASIADIAAYLHMQNTLFLYTYNRPQKGFQATLCQPETQKQGLRRRQLMGRM